VTPNCHISFNYTNTVNKNVHEIPYKNTNLWAIDVAYLSRNGLWTEIRMPVLHVKAFAGYLHMAVSLSSHLRSRRYPPRRLVTLSKQCHSSGGWSSASHCDARVGSQISSIGFVVDKVELGQVLPEYFGFPYQFSSIIRGWYQMDSISPHNKK
jgi:hypothetical protein